MEESLIINNQSRKDIIKKVFSIKSLHYSDIILPPRKITLSNTNKHSFPISYYTFYKLYEQYKCVICYELVTNFQSNKICKLFHIVCKTCISKKLNNKCYICKSVYKSKRSIISHFAYNNIGEIIFQNRNLCEELVDILESVHVEELFGKERNEKRLNRKRGVGISYDDIIECISNRNDGFNNESSVKSVVLYDDKSEIGSEISQMNTADFFKKDLFYKDLNTYKLKRLFIRCEYIEYLQFLNNNPKKAFKSISDVNINNIKCLYTLYNLHEVAIEFMKNEYYILPSLSIQVIKELFYEKYTFSKENVEMKIFNQKKKAYIRDLSIECIDEVDLLNGLTEYQFGNEINLVVVIYSKALDL